MTFCSIRWCGKNSKTSNYKTDGITFHRFPKEPDLKEKWIDATKRENWFPRDFSVICSRHFTEDCFYKVKSRHRLFKTAIPTQFLPLLGNASVSTEYAPENTIPIQSSSSQFESMSTTPITIKREVTDTETPSQIHSPDTKRLRRRILDLKMQVTHQTKTIKILRDKVRYYKKRVESLKIIIGSCVQQ